MSERWKPEIGETYWVVSRDAAIYNFVWASDAYDSDHYDVGNCFKTKEEAEAAAEKVKELLLSLHCNETLQENIQDMVSNTCQAMDKGKENVAKATCTFGNLPKLTAEVFDRPNCPDWAKYAAVSVGGLAYWYQYFPIADERIGVWKAWGNKRQLIDGFFDRSDWQNSLVERTKKENKLPEWCKVGEWVYCTQTENYGKILSVDAEQVNILLSSNETFSAKTNMMLKYGKAARLRPYNADEMKSLVGKVINWKDDAVLVTAYSKERNLAIFDSIHHTADDLLNGGYTINGKPAGVFEHLENGEWAE